MIVMSSIYIKMDFELYKNCYALAMPIRTFLNYDNAYSHDATKERFAPHILVFYFVWELWRLVQADWRFIWRFFPRVDTRPHINHCSTAYFAMEKRDCPDCKKRFWLACNFFDLYIFDSGTNILCI